MRSRLGAGGMGEVWLARDTSELDRTVAVKLLPAEVASDPARMQRFAQEARAVSALNHPNVLTVYEFGREGDTRFIATEYVEGVTLREHLSAHRLKLHEVLDIAAQVAAALDAAHEAHVVHRDIKPENIMVRRRDHIVKVLDFGLAKPVGKAPAPVGVDTEAGTRLRAKTEPGVVMGTVAYMSPEQSGASEHVDHRTDIWSLGAVLYEMVAGRVPFEGQDIHRQIIAIQEQEPPPLSRYAEGVPERLEEIVAKALAKDPDERYQSAKDLLIDLRSLKRKLKVDAEIDRTVSPEMRRTAGGATGGASHDQSTASQSAGHTIPVEPSHPTSSAEYIVTEVKRHRMGVIIMLAALLLASAAGAYIYFGRGDGAAIDSIAVLPFANAGNDPNVEYLSDGIAESLINGLTQLQQLRVIARTTAFRYKGKEVDPQAVGRELGVRAVLTGRVRQSGDRLNIQVDLVDASTGAQLWGEEYERAVSDVLSIKQAIAREVTEKLRLRLSGEQQRQLARRDTTNPEAYQTYLRGRYYWNKRTAEGIRKAIEEFQRAVERDPNYALGYVGLADSYLFQEHFTNAPTNEALPKARAAVDRALQLDDSLAEAHTTLAYIYMQQWRWAEAEQEFRRAISLNPNYATAHHWFSLYFDRRRQFDDALREIRRAQELDSLSPTISNNVTAYYMRKNDFDSAIEQLRRVIELDPNYPLAHGNFGWIYLKQRRHEEALAEFQKAVELSGRASEYLSDLGYFYAVTGRRDEALQILRELEGRYARREALGRDLAKVHFGLGDRDRVFAWLERDFQQRSGLLSYINSDLDYEPLRPDPRFADLLRRMGLEP